MTWLWNRLQPIKQSIDSKQPGIQMIISSTFTGISCLTILLISVIFYTVFSNRVVLLKTESAEQFLNQTKLSMEDYLRSNRRISDALYYSCIKDVDLKNNSFDESFNLVYEANLDNITSIMLYDNYGKQITSVPVSFHKKASEIIKQDWFINACNEVENLHFSTPHVEYLSDDSPGGGYRWVISLSRSVELTENGSPKQGILLVNIKYSSIQQMLEKVNSNHASEYIYLCDEEGNIIYHPKQELINAGLYQEETVDNAIRSDGFYNQTIGNDDLIIVTKTVSYTGWKLVSVVSKNGYNLGLEKMKNLLIFFICITFLGIIFMNQRLTKSITHPLIHLDHTIQEMEGGDLNPDIMIRGPREVQHLSKTLQSYIQMIQELMDEVLEEQELKRRSELDALQSQINPHFLYNTLDSVMWMIEDEQNDGAVYMIKELAKLLRISISKGRTLIPLRDEVRHAMSYMNIQNIRYKNQFSCEFDIDESLMDCCTIKLIIQPLLENAINHGVQGMEDDGEILVRISKEEDFVYIDVMDNGYGMTKEQVDHLLKQEDTEEKEPAKRGNGVGLKNVDTRIKMRFGPEYGLRIKSEWGEGTMMRICLPYMIYTNQLEEMLDHSQHRLQKNNRNEVTHEKE